MSSIHQLYQELIMDHARNPKNFSENPKANCILQGFNPLCGDKLTVYVDEKNGAIESISFQGNGCAISMASASLMTEVLRGKSILEAENVFSELHALVTTGKAKNSDSLGKLMALAGVFEFPARVKCATLAWHTVMGALRHQQQTISTE